MADCLARAFANLKLWCMANSLQVFSIRGFTVANMHANRNAFPWLGCKGADSIVILKWLLFYANLELQQQGVSKRPASPPLDFWWCSKWFSIFARNPWSWHLAGLLMCRSSSQSSASIWGQLRSPRCSLHGQKILSFWHGTKDPCLHAFSNRVRRCAGRWQACNVEPCSFRYQHVRRFCGPYQPAVTKDRV